jgi:16S rRNA (adenine1518-N6/adenine1519-N6)-dimethyltransferase
MKLSEMKQILNEGRIQLTRSLGQNFLHDRNQLERIAGLAELRPGDKVLEVGPGLGPLTAVLLERGAEVLAIEKDERLVRFLEEHFKEVPRLSLLHADALDYLKAEARDWSEWKLVANLPYSVASPILVELALAEHAPERLVATLQLEVAQRLMSSPASDDYGVLTLLVQLNYEPVEWFKIPASCFFPQPDVDSACVSLVRRREPILDRHLHRSFVKVVKRVFSQRRKMMVKLLKADWTPQKVEHAMQRMQVRPDIRAEKLSLRELAELTRLLNEEG